MKQSASARQSSRRRSLLWSSSRNSRHWFNPSKGWNSTTVWYGPLVIEFSGEKYPPLVGKSSTISLWYSQQSSGDLLAFTPRFNRLGENVDQPSRSKTFKITSPLSRQFPERYSSPIVDGQHLYSSQMERVRLPSFTLLDSVAHPGSKEICENCQKTNNKVSGGPSIGKKNWKIKRISIKQRLQGKVSLRNRLAQFSRRIGKQKKMKLNCDVLWMPFFSGEKEKAYPAMYFVPFFSWRSLRHHLAFLNFVFKEKEFFILQVLGEWCIDFMKNFNGLARWVPTP